MRDGAAARKPVRVGVGGRRTMLRLRTLRLGGSIALLAAGGWLTTSVAAHAAGASSATFVSQAGNYLTQGQDYSFPTVTFGGREAGSVEFTVSNPTASFLVVLAAPTGQSLTPGYYPDAQPWLSGPAGSPGISVSGRGQDCNGTGSFSVYDATYDTAGDPLSFAATFTMYCGGPAALFGSLSYNSSASLPALPLSVPAISGVSPSTGTTAGGTTVTVTGTGLNGATAVDFGTVAGTGASVNAAGTELTVRSPAEPAGNVGVTVSTAVGTSNVVPYVYDAPVLSGASPSGGPTAGGTTVTLTGTNLTGVTTVDFGSVPGTDVVVDASGSRLTVTSPAQSGGTVGITAGTSAATSDAELFTYSGPSMGTSRTAATFVSQAGDYLGQGQDYSFPTVSFDGSQLGSLEFTVSNPNTWFQVWLGAPGGKELDPGFYPGAQEPGFKSTSSPGLDVSRVGSWCNTMTGSFTVYDATYDASARPVSFAAEFTLHCGAVPALYGAVWYHSSAPMPPLPLATPGITGISPQSGTTAGGTTVTLTGGNLAGATGVDFGGVPGTDVSVNGSGTSLTVTTPASAPALVAVTVTTPTGTSNQVSYRYATPPTITALSPPTGPADNETAVTITGSNLSGETAVDFGTVPAKLVGEGPDGSSLTVMSPIEPAGTVPVTVIDPGGTSNPMSYTYAVAPPGGPFTMAAVVSQPGDFVGRGMAYSLPTVNVTTTGSDGALRFTVSSPTDSFDVVLAPPSGQSLNPGSYPDAQNYPFEAAGSPGLDVSGDGSGCSTVTGSFTVYDATYAGGVPQSFAAEFIQHCDGAAPALYGEIWYHSSAKMPPLPLPQPLPVLTGVDPAIGPTGGGTTVTLTGTDLAGATGVDFGSGPATGVSVNAAGTQVTATAPPSPAGVVLVTVVTPNGTTNGEPFTYAAPPPIPSGTPWSQQLQLPPRHRPGPCRARPPPGA